MLHARPRVPLRVLIFGLICAVSIGLYAAPAEAQIKRPGAHPRYSLELDPHLVLQHDRGPFYDDDGVGFGLRASIPFLDNGPIPQINNNMAMSFGGDFVFFDDDLCRSGRNSEIGDDCSATEFWLPVTVQWNFFFTRIVSAFVEPGLALSYARWSWDYPCNGAFCDGSESDLDLVNFVVFVGGRFLFGDTAGLTVRLGWPYISIGGTFLL